MGFARVRPAAQSAVGGGGTEGERLAHRTDAQLDAAGRPTSASTERPSHECGILRKKRIFSSLLATVSSPPVAGYRPSRGRVHPIIAWLAHRCSPSSPPRHL
ncbi:hypothetical protein GN956_G4746 [Arapaima gigas]